MMLNGAIVRMDTTSKDIYLCFTAHEFKDGFDYIANTLNEHKIKASFFFTGDFFRTPSNRKIVEKLKAEGLKTEGGAARFVFRRTGRRWWKSCAPSSGPSIL